MDLEENIQLNIDIKNKEVLEEYKKRLLHSRGHRGDIFMSEKFKLSLAIEMFGILAEGETYSGRYQFDDQLNSNESFVYADLEDRITKKNYVEVMGKMVECSSSMTPSEYLEVYNEGLRQVMEDGKITKKELNPELFSDSFDRGR